MWQGVPRSINPAFTVCGLDECIPCEDNAGDLSENVDRLNSLTCPSNGCPVNIPA